MIIREISLQEKERFNKLVTHPLQSWEWGEFRQKTGLKIARLGCFKGKELKTALQLSFHPLPKTKYQVGYLPKCGELNPSLLQALRKIGLKENCIFIKFEPNLTQGKDFFLKNGCLPGRPLFTKYTFQIDLQQSEETLLKNMMQKTRYNIKVAQKHEVTVVEDNSSAAFNEYLSLTFQTTKRQKFYAHDEDYHRKMWRTLNPAGIARLLKAEYQGKTLATWIVFVFNNILYYPYGASSREHKNVMASSLVMWEAIRFGKKIGCHAFDLWGSLGPNPNPGDPWFGFHRFKLGFGPKLVEFIGTFDLIINPQLYRLYCFVDNLRWKILKLKSLLT